MMLDIATLSERGPRSENEDSIISAQFGPDHTLIGVADGIGGHEGGKIASNLALKSLLEKLSKKPSALKLGDIAREIHSELRAAQLENPSQRGMATTLSAAVIHDMQLDFVHCGDSRIVVARNNGIRRITVDHSEAQRLYDAGKLSREQLATYPRKNILESALGIQGTPRIDEGTFRLQHGDKVFITSDGVHNKILLRELFAIASTCSNSKQVIERVDSEMTTRVPEDNYSLVCTFIL